MVSTGQATKERKKIYQVKQATLSENALRRVLASMTQVYAVPWHIN